MTARLRRPAAALAVLAAAFGAAAAPAAAAPPFVFAPYKDMSIVGDAAAPAAPRTLIWSFASGECGSERWGDVDGVAFAAAQVAAAVRSGSAYIVATGGANGVFTCASDEGLQRFVARYDSPLLVGFDFDIEGAQTAEQIGALAQRLARLQRERPALRLSFTVATHAAGDGSRRSLNATGEQVLQAIRAAGLDGSAIINLMVMNYGPPQSRLCVVKRTALRRGCDMARSALQAVRNLQQRHGVPAQRIAVTPMLGENDVAANVFTPDDAARLAREARALGLAGVHYWSLDRDRPCPPGAPRVSPLCHALPGVPPGRFGELLGAGPSSGR